jgi:hypothetical protein
MTTEVRALVCSHVFEDSRPVLLVAREDGEWLFLCGQLHAEDERFHVVGVNHLTDRDPTLTRLSSLGEEEEAERVAPGADWIRRPLTAEGGEATTPT